MTGPARARVVGALCLLAPLLSCRAQDAKPKTQRTTVPDSDTYEIDPAVDPARPTVTNPAHIPPPGYLQFEQGVLQANTTPGGGPDSQLSVVHATKLSLDHHLMVFVLSEPYARSSTAGAVSNDPGDVDVGAQVVLLDEGEGRGLIPSLALSYTNVVRSGSAADLDSGSFSRSLVALMSGTIHTFHYDANFLVNEQQGDTPNFANTRAPRRAQWGETISVTHDLPANLSISGELWRFTRPVDGGNAFGNLWTLGYQPHKTLVIDAGFSRGLTGESTHWETFAGFSYLLPHRLWGAKRKVN